MWARATRIEFVIVSVAFLVLFLCSKPPRSGSADVGDWRPELAEADWSAEEMTADLRGDARPADDASEETTLRQSDTLPVGATTDPAPQEPPKRLAKVDARNCERLDYGDVMYGEVTVRWVWNGTKFVPQKVCVVQEENGVSSVWSFDQPDDAVLSELPQDPR